MQKQYRFFYIRLVVTFFVAFLFVFVSIFFSLGVRSVPNLQINYQGKLTNASGGAVPDGTYHMKFWLVPTLGDATSIAVREEYLGAFCL